MKFIGMHSYRIGKAIPEYDLSTGWYCSHWGLTDLYEECEKGLRELLNSGADFITDWCGSKKETISARYSRYDGHIHVEVCQSMDDLWEEGDLIYDALPSGAVGEDGLPGYVIDGIKRNAFFECIGDSTTETLTLPTNASYEDVMEAVEWAEIQTDKRLSGWFEKLKEIVREHLEYMQEGCV